MARRDAPHSAYLDVLLTKEVEDLRGELGVVDVDLLQVGAVLGHSVQAGVRHIQTTTARLGLSTIRILTTQTT